MSFIRAWLTWSYFHTDWQRSEARLDSANIDKNGVVREVSYFHTDWQRSKTCLDSANMTRITVVRVASYFHTDWQCSETKHRRNYYGKNGVLLPVQQRSDTRHYSAAVAVQLPACISKFESCGARLLRLSLLLHFFKGIKSFYVIFVQTTPPGASK